MLGISVYFRDYDEEYLKEAAKAGAKYVFTSLQIPEEDYSNLDQKLPKFFKLCNDLKLEVIPDVSPVTLERLDIPKNNFKALKEKGFKALRLDYGFDDFKLVKRLQEDFNILLNASVVTPKYIETAKETNVDLNKLTLTYNFYPHTDTGMGWDDFKRKNWLFKDLGLRTQAFVPGDEIKRFPLYEGLPTVEKHRGQLPYVAAVELIQEANVDDIFIGDSRASIKQLRYIHDFQQNGVMNIECHLLKKYQTLYDQKFEIRKDIPEKIVRLTCPRTPGVAIEHALNRRKGSIVMQNKLAQRYSGEIDIVKQDLPFEVRSNVIGWVTPEYVNLLNYIDDQTKIVFKKID
ncbi:MupG family TIM beta-alpha barrel fold protein [Lactobacillus amylovorus]|uniref:MupG family TIM beta-alpha barrel fold protein n=1 Tax=Lactobacillus amylovorus TaxID=1604 RepID=A0A9X3W5J4_LACAM|nr:MupG family TIM beta-alpha barrel fold protein [Lactobacillus amylovorus]MDB6253823.1 MupG family TIM beta-alpha barrel fold protein [Lactobacillus amylovorus]MDB6257956.1 MupG family TIM beta-alpha barrel fold protein [Lactobacillus amylovorus]MDB6265725.1 MupG family TIM beta-alpha barrel fold protein [Lactobacillus amylovorus]